MQGLAFHYFAFDLLQPLQMKNFQIDLDVANTTPKCVLVHSRFHYILSEFGHFYHGEIGQPPSELGLVVMHNELVH
jgi:hypothetical protein